MLQLKLVLPAMLVVVAICLAVELLSLGTGQEWLISSL